MPTLFSQPPRGDCRNVQQDWDAVAVDRFERLKKLHGFDDRTTLELMRLADAHRQHEYRVSDLDAKDEQLAGFGELLAELIEVIRSLTPEDSDGR